MINITPTAVEKVKAVMEQEKESMPQGGLRIYVQGGGCSGFSYGMVLDEVSEGDQVFEQEGVKVIVDPMSMKYLENAEVDYKEDLMGGGFAIKNPNATSTCGCGHSFNAGGEGKTFQHRRRPRGHHVTVLDRARLAFGAVGDHQGLAPFRPHRPPLEGGGEPAPAPPAQAGSGQPVEDLGGTAHAPPALGQATQTRNYRELTRRNVRLVASVANPLPWKK